MNGLIRMGLGLEGVPDLTIDAIDKATPAFLRLLEAEKELLPILEPALKAAWPILQKAYPDAVSLLPVIQDLINFISAKGAKK